ncbi:MAG TPA: hypothetical protein VGM78_13545, partial [Ilumatobacteraceae bacterium]
MIVLLRFVMLGLGVGAVYALISQGLVLVYRGSGVVNFAQGAFAMVGAFVFYRVRDDWHDSTPTAFVLAIGATMILAALTHLFLLRQLRKSSPLVRLVATLGLFFLLRAAAERLWGDGTEPVTSPLPTTVRRPFGPGAPISEDRLWLLVIAVLVTAVLWALFRWTSFGWKTEAVAENPVVASTLGISPDAVAAANWALGGGLAALAGILIAPILFLSVAALSLVVLRGLAGALLGRFRSFWATLVGSLSVGVLESVLSRFVEHKGVFRYLTTTDGRLFGLFSPQSISRSAAFGAILVAVVVAGRSIPLRSELLDRLPRVGSGRVRIVPTVIVTAIGVTAMLAGPKEWTAPAIVSIGVATICLSVVLVTGYVGQLSLAQLALAGFGAWAAARITAIWGWPIPLAMIAGVLITIPLGLLVALPALRTRGVNLAIVTFGLAVVIAELVFGNPDMTGGFIGTRIGASQPFGISLDGTRYPGRYGAVALVIFVLIALVVLNIRRGPSGRRLIAVRANERAASSLGVNVRGAKLFGFGVGAGIAAAGGIIIVFRQAIAGFAPFEALGSIQIVVYTVVGGLGYVTGAAVGGGFGAGGIGGHIIKELVHSDKWLNLVAGVLLLITVLANQNGMVDKFALRRNRGPNTKRRAAAPVLPPSESLTVQAPMTLEISELVVAYGATRAIDGVTMSVRPGNVTGLMGPNGAGKTSLVDA